MMERLVLKIFTPWWLRPVIEWEMIIADLEFILNILRWEIMLNKNIFWDL